jgi:hypothetical protein
MCRNVIAEPLEDEVPPTDIKDDPARVKAPDIVKMQDMDLRGDEECGDKRDREAEGQPKSVTNQGAHQWLWVLHSVPGTKLPDIDTDPAYTGREDKWFDADTGSVHTGLDDADPQTEDPPKREPRTLRRQSQREAKKAARRRSNPAVRKKQAEPKEATAGRPNPDARRNQAGPREVSTDMQSKGPTVAHGWTYDLDP